MCKKFFNVKRKQLLLVENSTLNWAKDELFTNISYAYVQAKESKLIQDLPSSFTPKSITLTSGLQNEVYGIMCITFVLNLDSKK